MSPSSPPRSKRRKTGAPAPIVSDVAPAPDAETAPDASEEAIEAAPVPEEAAELAEAEPPVEEEASAETIEALAQTGEHPAATASDDATVERQRIKRVIESLVFVADHTVTAMQLGRMLKLKAALVRDLIAELTEEYNGRGIELVEVAGGYQFRSAASSAEYVREFVAQRPVRLTRAQLETLALIAYRQPITRPEVDEVRGVDSGSAVRVLLERDLIKMLGRKDEPGRPLLYGTTNTFLEFFGMRTLRDLPTLREFTELNDENRALFKRKTGEEVEEAEALLAAAEEAARLDGEEVAHVSDADLAELAAQADREEGEGEPEPAHAEPPVAAAAEASSDDPSEPPQDADDALDDAQLG